MVSAEIWIYSIVSVVIVSLISFIGVISLAVSMKLLKKLVLVLVSFSAGSLFGGAFFHLIPKASEAGFGLEIAVYVLLGIIAFFILEKFIHWRHCHVPTSKDHPHPFGIMNLVGDAFHNLIDGMIIGVSYIVSVPLGIATTVAVIAHEVPQEMGDFGVLIHAGFSRAKALILNFVSALTAVLGVLLSLVVGARVEGFAGFLVPFTAGGFIYIAGSDLIPELKKECGAGKSFVQLVAILAGLAVMIGMTFLE